MRMHCRPGMLPRPYGIARVNALLLCAFVDQLRFCFMLGLLMVCLRPLLAQPANDHFTNAIPLTSLAGAYTGTNHFAASDPGEPSHGVSCGGKSVWFQWMAPSTT